MKIEYAAHIRDDGKVQTILQHLEGTAGLALNFAHSFRSDDLAYLCAIYHGIGKYSDRFQKRIYEGGNPVDHSTAGAIEIHNLIPHLGFLLAYCISGHHGGLPDGGSLADVPDESTLHGKLKRTPEPYDRFRDDLIQIKSINNPLIPIHLLENGGFSLSFYIRMLFSCLVDADFLDTEDFMDHEKSRGKFNHIFELNQKLDNYIKNFSVPKNSLNTKRTSILDNCILQAQRSRGLFSLTVPTGGGKTISSLAFAIKHALINQMDRVIYVIPYNSIIEQNAAVFKKILGKDQVLEHHSDYNYDQEEDTLINQKHKLAAENWDMPVIVTTNVQFFESLFSNRTSKCRKLHHLANSVIIFDEAQMLPINYLVPSVRAISELVVNYNSSIVLCSATQPYLKDIFPKDIKITELSTDSNALFQQFKKTKIIDMGDCSDEDLTGKINFDNQALCIVNTRKHAQTIFNRLEGEGCYHLSTLMYPIHRKRTLDTIRTRLSHGDICRVVSTSLIEAGVDVDFPVVYREEAGLDSVIQAAGRCNREAKAEIQPVYIFRSEEHSGKKMPESIQRPVALTRIILKQFEEVDSPQAIQYYFSELYNLTGNSLDSKNIVNRMEDGMRNGLSFPFAEIAKEFRLIETETKAVLIPPKPFAEAYSEEGMNREFDANTDAEPSEKQQFDQMILRLRGGERSRDLVRNLQSYTVNVYERDHRTLYESGLIEVIDEQFSVLLDLSKYHECTGLVIEAECGVGLFA